MGSIRNMLISGEMQIGMSATILIALIIVTYKLSTYISSMRNNIKENKALTKYNKFEIEKLHGTVKEHSNKIQEIEISDAENKIRILNIDTRVVEILSILKDK